MHRTIHVATLVLALIGTTFVVLAGSAAAQGLDEPLQDKLDEKRHAAEEDPVDFAQTQTTEAQLAHDANWTIAYTCFVAHEAERESGADLPELEQCANFEQALGIAEEAVADEEDEVVADAQELEDNAIIEAEALASDALATTDEVLDDPAGALDALAAFADRTMRAIQRLLGGITGEVGASTALVGEALDLLGKGCTIAVAAPLVGAHQLGVLLWDAGVTGANAVATGVSAAVAETAAAVTATTDALTSGADATWDAITSAATAVQDAFSGLLGTDATPRTPDHRNLPEQTRPVTDTTDSLLDKATGALGT